jgi:hypothetical protein
MNHRSIANLLGLIFWSYSGIDCRSAHSHATTRRGVLGQMRILNIDFSRPNPDREAILRAVKGHVKTETQVYEVVAWT